MNASLAVHNPPFFSVITVCLNEPHLERTCESIVNQTFQDFEWIVIDGGSNEATLAVFDKYRYRMKHFVSEPDGGIFFGMNKGIERATGQWVNFMNAGDCFANAAVLQAVHELMGQGADSAGVVYGNFIVTDGRHERVVATLETVDRESLYFTTPHHEACFFQKRLFDAHGGYNTSYSLAADWEFALKLFTRHRCHFRKIDLPILIYSQSGRSSVNQVKVFEEISKVRAAYFLPEEIRAFKQRQAEEVRLRLTAKSGSLP